MNYSVKLSLSFVTFFIGILILIPEFFLSGHRINFSELSIYAIFFVYLICVRGRIYCNPILYPYILYVLAFAFSLSVSFAFGQKVFVREGLYILRQAIQLCLLGIMLSVAIKNSSFNEIKRAAFVFAVFITIPSVIAILQYHSPAEMKSLLNRIYQPVYFFEELSDRVDYRVTSIFKDSYIASVFLVVASGYLFSLFLSAYYLLVQKFFLLMMLMLVYYSSFRIGRTAVVFIPMFCLLIIIFRYREFSFLKLFAYQLSALVFICLVIAGFYLLSEEGSKNLVWVKELITIFDGSGNFSSYDVMHEMNRNAIEYLINNSQLLFLPLNQTPDSYFQQHMYADNFYIQEIYRYGVYGLISYALFLCLLLYIAFKSKYSFALAFALVFAILNYKGGNTFLLARASLVYPVLLLFVHYFELRNKNGKP